MLHHPYFRYSKLHTLNYTTYFIVASQNVSMEEEVFCASDDASSELVTEDDDDDSSLDNFLQRLKGRTATVQTIPEVTSATTQTILKEGIPFQEKILRVSRNVERDVMSLIAPRGRPTTQDPTFFTAPPRRTVQLVARPSSARVPETKKRVMPKPKLKRRNSVTTNNVSRPSLYTPKVEPRKKIAHELPWY